MTFGSAPSPQAPELKGTGDRSAMEETSRGQGHRGRRRVALSLYAGTALVSLVMGTIYGLRDSFMPYHAVALGQSWSELDPASRVLIKALMDVAAGGWLALGALVLLLVAVPIRRGERWARFAAPGALLLFYVPTLLATLSVLRATPATPPWRFNLVACLCAVAGLLLDAPWRGGARTPAGVEPEPPDGGQ